MLVKKAPRALRIAAWIPLGAAALLGQGTVEVADFFGGFEGASLIGPEKVGPNHFSIEAQSRKRYGDQGALGTWACAGIRVRKAGGLVRITVKDGNRGSDLRAVYGHDLRNWKPVPSQRNSFDFDVPLEEGRKTVYFATFYPYPLSRMTEHNKTLAKSRYVRLSTLGKSVHGRPVVLAAVTDQEAPAERKKRAFLLGGTHGAETASIYGVEGMLNFLVSDDPSAAELRRGAVWHIIPIHNVDAAAEGLDRRNGAGINLYYDWGFHEMLSTLPVVKPGSPPDPSISARDFSQPETRAAWDAIVQFRPQIFLDVHSWHFAGDGYWGPEPAAATPAIEALKKSIAVYFKIRHWNRDPFPYASAATVAKKLGIAATLPEFALSVDSDNQVKTPDSMRRQGVAILRGAWEYLKTLD